MNLNFLERTLKFDSPTLKKKNVLKMRVKKTFKDKYFYGHKEVISYKNPHFFPATILVSPLYPLHLSIVFKRNDNEESAVIQVNKHWKLQMARMKGKVTIETFVYYEIILVKQIISSFQFYKYFGNSLFTELLKIFVFWYTEYKDY